MPDSHIDSRKIFVLCMQGIFMATPLGNRDRGRRGSPRRSPPTPPDMRVRIRRFGWLRLASKSRDAHPVVVARGQGGVKRPVGRDPPPASGLGGGRTRDAIGDAPGAQLAIDRRSTLPLLELRGTQAVTNPLIEAVEDARRISQTEVGLPSGEIAPQLRTHRCQAPSPGPGGDPPDPRL